MTREADNLGLGRYDPNDPRATPDDWFEIIIQDASQAVLLLDIQPVDLELLVGAYRRLRWHVERFDLKDAKEESDVYQLVGERLHWPDWSMNGAALSTFIGDLSSVTNNPRGVVVFDARDSQISLSPVLLRAMLESCWNARRGFGGFGNEIGPGLDVQTFVWCAPADRVPHQINRFWGGAVLRAIPQWPDRRPANDALR